MNNPSPAVLAAMKSTTTTIPADKLEAIQRTAKYARDLELSIAHMEEELRNLKLALNKVYQDNLPQMMQEVGLDKIGIAKEGNYPGYDYKLKKFYRANIASKWDEEKREAAFEYVKSMGAEDLIKTEVVVLFPKGGLKLAQKLVAAAKKINVQIKVGKKKIKKPVQVELSKSIPWATLSAWLKELVEKHHKVPSAENLEKIGGSIGVVVEPEERKE